MKKLFILILSIFFIGFVSATTTKLGGTENWHSYSVLKIQLDWKSKIVVPTIDNWQDPQSLKTLTNRVWWTHAINWWFFQPASYTTNNIPYTDGLRIFEWKFYSKRGKDIASNRTVFWFDWDWKPMPLVERDWRYRENWWRENKWFIGMKNWMMMPTLVKNWINVAVLNSEMNNDPKQWKAWEKTFICSTRDNSIVYMWYVSNVTFSSIANYIIDTFACYNAILLDGGWTRSMMYKSQYVVWPWRDMMDAFVVIEWDNIWADIKETKNNYIVNTDNEKLENAIMWMYNAGLTMYNDVEHFLPDNNMTREEASKFFSVFAKKEFGLREKSNNTCNFTDTKWADQTLVSSITSSCRLWIFKWYNNKFMFKDKLTNAQAVTVLMRIMFGTMQEPTSSYYTNYLLKAKEIWLVWNINVKSNITRWEAAIMLYDSSIYREEIDWIVFWNANYKTVNVNTQPSVLK